jgi:hypothetical protein
MAKLTGLIVQNGFRLCVPAQSLLRTFVEPVPWDTKKSNQLDMPGHLGGSNACGIQSMEHWARVGLPRRLYFLGKLDHMNDL